MRRAYKKLIKLFVVTTFLIIPALPILAANVSSSVAEGERQLTYENWDKALTAYDSAIQESPGVAILYLQRGITKDRLLDFKGAQTDFNKAIELDSRLTAAYYYRAFLHDNLGRRDQAIKDVERTLSLEPKHSGAIKLKEIITNRKGRKKAGDYLVTYTSLKDICADAFNANWRFAEIKINTYMPYFEHDEQGLPNGVYVETFEENNGIYFRRISPELKKQAAALNKENEMLKFKEPGKAHYTLLFRVRTASCRISTRAELQRNKSITIQAPNGFEGENFLKATRLR